MHEHRKYDTAHEFIQIGVSKNGFRLLQVLSYRKLGSHCKVEIKVIGFENVKMCKNF